MRGLRGEGSRRSLKDNSVSGDAASAPRLMFQSLRRSLLTYAEFARVAFLRILAFRLRYFTGIVTYFINVSVYYFIWRAVYADSGRVAGYSLNQMITYVAVGWVIRSFYFNTIDRDMTAEVLEGRIASNLIKPVNAQWMYLFQTFGESFFRAFSMTLPVSLVLFFVYPIQPPASAQAMALFVPSCCLSVVIVAAINFAVGTLALRIQSILGVIRAKYFIVEFLSGLLLPLTFFPRPVQRALVWMPFPHISYTPLQIYLGREAGLAALGALGAQAAWAVILIWIGHISWQSSIRRLAILGG